MEIEDKVIEMIQQVRPIGDTPVRVMPATDTEIKAFENAHGFILPDEVRSWFRRCDGANIRPGGLDSLFPKDHVVCLDWHFKRYPEWKSKGWIPLASDGCGDLYVLTKDVLVPATGTHPVFFLDQADFAKPDYVVASGVWRFLFFLLEDELLRERGEAGYWPFDRERVLALDPALGECRGIPLPWEADV